jgi:hypothetical protein
MRLLDTWGSRLVGGFLVFLTISLVFGLAPLPSLAVSPASITAMEKDNNAPLNTGNLPIDETFRGIERASNWTDRALMLGMLVIVLFMTGYFLKMANDEIKRQRTISSDEAAKFLETARDSVKALALNSTALVDASRQMELNRAIAERVLRSLERVEAELVKFERAGYGRRSGPRSDA